MALLRPSRIAFGCSILSPSRSQRLCCVVSSNASVSLRGHWNFPLSSLLYRSRKPSPSQSNPLMRSHRLPQNKNNAVLYGSSCNCAWTIVASPSMERRRSVYPVTMYVCWSGGRLFSIIHAPMRSVFPPAYPRAMRSASHSSQYGFRQFVLALLKVRLPVLMLHISHGACLCDSVCYHCVFPAS